MSNFQKAYDYAYKNPDSEFGYEFRRRFSVGEFDDIVKTEGGDLNSLSRKLKIKRDDLGGKKLEGSIFKKLGNSIKTFGIEIGEGFKAGEERGENLQAQREKLKDEGSVLAKGQSFGLHGATQRLAEEVASPLLGAVGGAISGVAKGGAELVGPDFIERGKVGNEGNLFKVIGETDIAKNAIAKLKNFYDSQDEETQFALKNAGLSAEILASVPTGGIAAKGAKIAGKEALAAGKVAVKEGAAAGEAALKAVKPFAQGIKRKAASAAGATIGKSGEVAQFGIGQITGLNPDTITFIKNNPSLYSAVESGKITNESIFEKAISGIEQSKQSVSELGKEYSSVRKLPIEVATPVDKVNEILSNRGLQVVDGKVSEVSTLSSNLSANDLKIIEDATNLITSNKTLTPDKVLNLRNRLDDMVNWKSEASQGAETLVRQLRGAVDDVAKKQIPELARLDKQFGAQKRELDLLLKDYLNKDGSIKDNAMSKLLNLTGKNKAPVLERIETVAPGITQELNALKALENVEYVKGRAVGAYARGALIGGALSVGNPMAALVGAILSSPSTVVPIIKAYGRLMGKRTGGIINKIEKGVALSGKEADLAGEAIQNAAKTLSSPIGGTN